MQFRSIFISDVHLGTSNSQADKLLHFMKDHSAEQIFLVGDIIDGWELKRRWKWPQAHSDVVQKLLRQARKGTRVVYVLGNHDEFIRPFLPLMLGDNLELVNETQYTDLKGREFLVTHGDLFDSITMTKKWLALLGDRGYLMLLRINKPLNWVRKRMGWHYWSFSKFVKRNVKKAVMYITSFEEVLAQEAKNRGVDGVICGHIHEPEIREVDGILYHNCGDWVESCSVLVETVEGEWKILMPYEKEH